MQIWTCHKQFEPFQFPMKIQTIQSMHSNVNSNHSNQIRSIEKQSWTLWKRFEAYSSHLKGILTIRIQIWTIWKGFKHSNANSNYSKGIWMQILTIRKGFEAYSNANSNQLKGIRSIRMQI